MKIVLIIPSCVTVSQHVLHVIHTELRQDDCVLILVVPKAAVTKPGEDDHGMTLDSPIADNDGGIKKFNSVLKAI